MEAKFLLLLFYVCLGLVILALMSSPSVQGASVVTIAGSRDEIEGQSQRTKPSESRMGSSDSVVTQKVHQNEIVFSAGIRSLSQSHSRSRRVATARSERVWDHGVIPYEVDGNFTGSHKTLFKQAMRHWENNTCLRFVERTPEHHNYIVFTVKACGCCSFVGKRGNGAQAISIGKGCDKFGVVVHELGHAVGLWHEHTRPDRDEHVMILKDNILTGQEYNFNKLTADEVNSLGVSYDFNSIMHYAKNTFSRNPYLDTILPRPDQRSGLSGQRPPEIGQRIKLSDGDITQVNKLYKCSACGRTFHEPTGNLSSQFYRENGVQMSTSALALAAAADAGERCEWRIAATHGEKIRLTLKDLDIPESKDCLKNYLEIRDGYWIKSPLLGRFCGQLSSLPSTTLISTGARLLLTYVTSENPSKYRGLDASFEAICGGELTGDSGHIESPNFPEEYFPMKECRWKITVPQNYKVALSFNFFDVETREDCAYDFVEIRDGPNANSTLLGKYCGRHLPPAVLSAGSELWIRFKSDDSVNKGGFSATFTKEIDECATGLHNCEHHCRNTIGSFVCGCKYGFELSANGRECKDACGGRIEALNGTLTSPLYPDLYPKSKRCAWEIVGPAHSRITLNFTHFDIEGSDQECDFDRVQVLSGPPDDEVNHGSFCGSDLPAMITSEGSSIRVLFNSDNSMQKTGFALDFFADVDECQKDNGGCAHTCTNTLGSFTCSCTNGFALAENGRDCKETSCKFELESPPNGEIQSRNYPESYPSNEECLYVIKTKEGHRVEISFDDFEVESHPDEEMDCTFDVLMVYDGPTSEYTLLGKFCGTSIPEPVVSSTNYLTLLFKSDGWTETAGFHGRHTSVCGGSLIATDSDSFFYSHPGFGTRVYDNSEDCEWVIESEDEIPIEVTFLSFQVEESRDCGVDYVEVLNEYADTKLSRSVGRYCGNRIPPTFTSEEGSVIIRFKTDDTIAQLGFKAVYRIAVDSEIFKPNSVNSIDRARIELIDQDAV